MTPTRRRECLALLRWTQRGFAAVIGWDEGTVRRWLRDGGEAPAEIDSRYIVCRFTWESNI